MFHSWWRLMLSISMVMNARSTPLRLSNSVCLRALHADCSQHDVPWSAMDMLSCACKLLVASSAPSQRTWLTCDMSDNLCLTWWLPMRVNL